MRPGNTVAELTVRLASARSVRYVRIPPPACHESRIGSQVRPRDMTKPD
jgi:hypothetical protein